MYIHGQYQWFLYLYGIRKLEFSFARFWKIITLVFLEFISNIQELQKEDSVLRQFCNPILDRDIIIKSSAYKSEFNLVPFGRMIGSDKVFWNADGKSLSYKLKSKALKVSVKENEVPTEKNSSRASTPSLSRC